MTAERGTAVAFLLRRWERLANDRSGVTWTGGADPERSVNYRQHLARNLPLNAGRHGQQAAVPWKELLSWRHATVCVEDRFWKAPLVHGARGDWDLSRRDAAAHRRPGSPVTRLEGKRKLSQHQRCRTTSAPSTGCRLAATSVSPQRCAASCGRPDASGRGFGRAQVQPLAEPPQHVVHVGEHDRHDQ